ncbi:SEFIR domain-containing protein, partial [Pseudomonas sp. HMWF021]|uniref:SEFIR domain-containing protein n=1 Tax=Pseudomonas sp. HMWF021 TaxID=2056857 RepID=UPI000D33818C
MSSPKVFISYSWSSEEHEAWVVSFAEQLMQAGIDAVLDKWELLPTHDASKFMERMVNDQTINKVLMICDETYTRKANERGATGVSTETQIISPAIYAGTSPEKFVAILTQRDESGKPYVPTYYSSKIFIDFSNPAKESESFEELVRFIYGKPRHKKPELGKAPAYLDDSETLSLGTTITFNRAISALRDSKPYAEGAVEEYLATFLENISLCKISFAELDEEAKLNTITDSLSALIPYRNEIVQFFDHVARYAPSYQYIKHVHKFFESFINFLFFQGVGRHTDWDFDNYKFLGKELFLYFTALLIKHDRLEVLAEFLSLSYYIKADNHIYGKKITDHSIFSWSINSLDYKNRVQKLGKT